MDIGIEWKTDMLNNSYNKYRWSCGPNNGEIKDILSIHNDLPMSKEQKELVQTINLNG